MVINNIDTGFAAKGDILVAGSNGLPTHVTAGTNGQFLTVNNSVPEKSQPANLNTNPVSWTPTVTGSGSAGTVVYTKQEGIYLTIGNLAVVWGIVEFNTFTGTGNLQLPFPLTLGAGNIGPQQSTIVFDGTYTAGNNVIISANPSTNFGYISCSGSGVGVSIQQCVATANIHFFIFFALD